MLCILLLLTLSGTLSECSSTLENCSHVYFVWLELLHAVILLSTVLNQAFLEIIVVPVAEHDYGKAALHYKIKIDASLQAPSNVENGLCWWAVNFQSQIEFYWHFHGMSYEEYPGCVHHKK